MLMSDSKMVTAKCSIAFRSNHFTIAYMMIREVRISRLLTSWYSYVMFTQVPEPFASVHDQNQIHRIGDLIRQKASLMYTVYEQACKQY